MALLGLGTNMQNNGYSGGCYITRDLIGSVNACARPLINDDRMLNHGHCFSGLMSPVSADQHLVYSKEILKQIMLKHESIFKDQIQELHRLYRRHAELMVEMKKNESYKHYTQTATACSNFFPSVVLSEYSWKSCQQPTFAAKYDHNAASGQEKISTSTSGKIMLQDRNHSETGNAEKDPFFSESKCKKFGKKLLDLELPADEYIDSEEELSGEDKNISTAAGASSCYFRTTLGFVNGKPSVVSDSVNFSHGDFSLPASSMERTGIFADLNKPIELGEGTASLSGGFTGLPGYNATSCNVMSARKTIPEFDIALERVRHDTQSRQDLKTYLNVSPLERKQSFTDTLSSGEKNGQSKSSFTYALFSERLPFSSGPTCKETYKPMILPYFDQSCQKLEAEEGNSAYILENPVGKYSRSNDNRSMPTAIFASSLQYGIPGIDLTCYGSPSVITWRNSADEMKHKSSSEAPVLAGDKFLCRNLRFGLQSYGEYNNDCLPSNNFYIPDGSENTKLVSERCDPEKLVGSVCTKSSVKDINLNFMPPSSGVEVSQTADERGQVEDPERDLPSLRPKSLHDGAIDLNVCTTKDHSALTPAFFADINLEVPASPENEEGSPPGRDSDEDQLQKCSPMSGLNDGNLEEELFRIAAEAIVSISSSQVPTPQNSSTSKHEQFQESLESLCWFASIVCTVDQESDVEGNLFTVDHELLLDGMDYFEVMTLKLTEMRVEENLMPGHGQKDEEINNSPSPTQLQKGRTRRVRQRNNFQSEILPSIASLTRNEVTEDLQTIGGLTEASGTHLEPSPAKTSGRSGLLRGKRRPAFLASDIAGSVPCKTAKQQPSCEHGIVERTLVNWGHVTRRRRGQRYPISNPQLILGQV